MKNTVLMYMHILNNIYVIFLLVCDDTFSRVNGTLLYGGILMNKYTKEADCWTYCLSEPKCLAFDFNFYLLQCYIHTNLTGKPLDLSVKDVAHFRRESCVTTSKIFSITHNVYKNNHHYSWKFSLPFWVRFLIYLNVI